MLWSGGIPPELDLAQWATRLHGASIESHGDHRIAMSFAVAALAASGETRIDQAECADVSFPGFFDVLARLSSGLAPHALHFRDRPVKE